MRHGEICTVSTVDLGHFQHVGEAAINEAVAADLAVRLKLISLKLMK